VRAHPGQLGVTELTQVKALKTHLACRRPVQAAEQVEQG